MKKLLLAVAALVVSALLVGGAQSAIPIPEQFFGFRMGTDNKLARWDKIVEYFTQVSGTSDRIRFRELGKSTNGSPFIALEIASADTLKNLDRAPGRDPEALEARRRAPAPRQGHRCSSSTSST